MLTAAIAEELQQLERGIKMYHAGLKQNVLLVTPVLLVMCDNPRASEVLCHLGSAANKFCRMCLVCQYYKYPKHYRHMYGCMIIAICMYADR